MEETHGTLAPRFASFGLGLLMGLLLLTFQKLQIQPLDWLPHSLFMKVQAIMLDPKVKKASEMEVVAAKLATSEDHFLLHRENTSAKLRSTLLSDIQAGSYLALDYDTGAVILEKDVSDRHAIASLTKVMTAMVVLDLVSQDDYFTISKHASEQIPTTIGVVPNQKMKVSELMQALLMTSANDAASVLQEGIDAKYGAGIFIRAMNMKARNIGLKNSSFDNPQGFDGPRNYSTAGDLALLSHYALIHYPPIREVVSKEYAFLPTDQNHKQYDLYNWNGLLGVYPHIEGVKIGNTDQAGKTTIVLAERDGKKVLVVLLGAPTVLDRDLWASQLLDAAFADAFGLVPIAVSEDALRAKYATWIRS